MVDKISDNPLVLPHKYNGQTIPQRAVDGFINATAMCKSAGKEWSNYRQNAQTEAFVTALEGSLGIPRDLLIQSISTGANDQRGTWVHPQLAISLATWLSPKFAVQVSEWVVSWMVGLAQNQQEYPDFESLSEDAKRLYLRDQVSASNKLLAKTAQKSGVKTPKDFGIFNSKGYQGMYGGRGVKEIRDHKGLAKKAAILDHMGSTELAANLFRITQTEEKLVKDTISNKWGANQAHYEVGQKVRAAMLEMSGILPEDLPVEPDVKKLQRERVKKLDSISTLPNPKSVDLPLLKPVEVNLQQDLWKYALLVMVQQ